MITRAQLLHVMPTAAGRVDVWLVPLLRALARWQINSPNRIAHWLGQVAHESAELAKVEENLTYTKADRILAVWPSRFVDLEDARTCVRNPEQLANRVYALRMGNGGRQTGDGYRYRGRGLIQVSGRDNYLRCSVGLYGYPTKLLNDPDLLLQPDTAAESAAWFWHAHSLSMVADQDDGRRITQVINGGLTGYSERMRYVALAKEALQ